MTNLVEKVKNAGVVGAGGAGFPTHVKISNKVEIVIANGAECEPLLRVDQQVMANYAEKVATGLIKVKEASGAKRAVIALKKKYKDAWNALEKIANKSGIELFPLGAFYPAGDEFTLVYEVTGRVIPEASLPLNVGCIVQNVHTLCWIADADEGKPVTERFVTVNGTVKRPLTFLVPIGTPVSEVIYAAGGINYSGRTVIIDGGPMMGKFINESAVVTKRTSGILVFPEDHPYVIKRSEVTRVSRHKAGSACTVCEDCTKYCPRFILGHRVLPHRAMRASAMSEDFPPMEGYALTGAICCECGLCTLWSCPMDLRPREMMQAIKRKMVETKKTNPFKGEKGEVHPAYTDRKIPVDRIIKGLYLSEWDVPAPMQQKILPVRRVMIPINQHLGASAKPVVSINQKVKRGDLIGEIPEGALGARIHASISGVITKISDIIEIEAK